MPRTAPAADWSAIMLDASMLWAEAGTVMALRSWRVMAGGAAAQRELEQMVSEKVAAGLELAGALAGGRVTTPHGAARKALGIYGRHVRGNRRRLA